MIREIPKHWRCELCLREFKEFKEAHAHEATCGQTSMSMKGFYEKMMGDGDFYETVVNEIRFGDQNKTGIL